jgi:hypothetical protein
VRNDGSKSKQFETQYSKQTRGVLEYETGERNDADRESDADKKKNIYKKKTNMGNINDRISPGRNLDGSRRATVDRRAYSVKRTLPTGTNAPIRGKSGASWGNVWCWSARGSNF